MSEGERLFRTLFPAVLLLTVALVDGWLLPYLRDRWRRRARRRDFDPR
jgi:hypothetical protein